MKERISIFWLRRDLRLHDNSGLYHALKNGLPILPIFIFDTSILNLLLEKDDKRVQFIYDRIIELKKELEAFGSSLKIIYTTPLFAFELLLQEYEVKAVYCNNDYEPYAIKRDETISNFLKQRGINLYSYKDHVVFEKDEILKDNGEAYTVFTPYSKKWKANLTNDYLNNFTINELQHNFYKTIPLQKIELKEMGFITTNYTPIPSILNETVAKDYDKTRDFPAILGTTYLGVHLRFGTISIRQLAQQTSQLNQTLINELIWREFYQMILWHFPYVVNSAFKPAYNEIAWRQDEVGFQKWCRGETGYPIVDAGMKQLNATGYMHNRVRMITASFLTKHLLINWQWGEAYFAKKLMDFDLAANNGGWQWAAGTGCDAAPYFRIFNPYLQTQKFDPELKYIKQWIPGFNLGNYIKPIVEHEFARVRCLEVYKKSLYK